MKRGWLVLAIALATLAPVNGWASVHRGGAVARPYHRVWSGPYIRPYWGTAWGPYWGSYWGPGWPYWGGYWVPSNVVHPNTGVVKLDTKVKDAQVFINGAYAGTTHEEKTMRLRPGKYNIEIREAGQARFAEDVYVVAGQTVHLRPAL
jgi:PEGA domain